MGAGWHCPLLQIYNYKRTVRFPTNKPPDHPAPVAG
jgi:hypothetical protein